MRKSCTNRKINVLTMSAINVPMALLQEVKKDRLEFSLAALSVAMKCYSPSSTYIFMSEHKFRHDFHIGYRKAELLLKALWKGHPLFRVEHLHDGRTIIVARSLKNMYGHWMTMKNGKLSLEMSVAKVSYRSRSEIRITEIEKEMQQLLFLTNINAKTRADELQTKGLPLKGSSSHAAKTVLSVNYLGKAINRSSRTVVRLNKSVKEQGLVRVTSHPLCRCCNNVLHEDLNAPAESLIPIGFFGFTRQCNDYQLLSWDWRKRFQHIIYRHRKRLTFNIYSSKDKPLSQTDLHALYD